MRGRTTRIALAVAGLVVVGGAITGTAMAAADGDPTQPAPTSSQPEEPTSSQADEPTSSQQEVLVLRYLHDMSVEETAEELGLSPGTVKSQSARAVATLRKRLGPHFAVLASAAATVAVIIAIIVATGATTAPKPVEPAVPPETSTSQVTPTSSHPSEPTSSSADAPTSSR